MAVTRAPGLGPIVESRFNTAAPYLAMHPLEALRATRVGTIVGLCGPQNGT